MFLVPAGSRHFSLWGECCWWLWWFGRCRGGRGLLGNFGLRVEVVGGAGLCPAVLCPAVLCPVLFRWLVG